MKKRNLLIADQAQEDLLDIWLYIATDSPLAADNFLDTTMKNVRPSAPRPSLEGPGTN